MYGPLHTAEQPIYTPRPSPTTATALDLPDSPSPSLVQPFNGLAKKPILKHRSICELLTSEFPASPLFSPPESDDEPIRPGESKLLVAPHGPPRPSLTHTKSDTQVMRWGPDHLYRRTLPPSVAPSMVEMHSTLLQTHVEVVPHQKRKHISFNTFVQQCIAIDQPPKKQPLANWKQGSLSNGYGNGYGIEDDGSVGSHPCTPRTIFDRSDFLATTRIQKTAS